MAEDAKAKDPQILAQGVWEAVTAAKPKARYAVGHDPATAVTTKRPAQLFDKLIATMFR